MRASCGERGFTLIEVMVSILLTVIAVIGIMGLYRVQTRATGYSRHTTEATVLGEDKLEQLRSLGVSQLGTCANAPVPEPIVACPPATPVGCSEVGLDSTGNPVPGGLFSRVWSIQPSATLAVGVIQLDVCWVEEGDIKDVVLRGQW
jgi:hypothetical protein